MSTPWNASHTSNENSRPRVLSPPMLVCRICNQIFHNVRSLIQHYESHDNELNQRPQNHQTNAYLSSLRESRDRNLTNNPFQPRPSNSSTFQQRHHPYLPSGFRMLRHERSSTPQNTLVLASTQNQILQPPRHPVATNNAGGASFQIPRTSGRNVAGSSPFLIHPRMPSAQRVSLPQRVPVPNFQEQKEQNESADTRTLWYLSQLEKPIPKVIDLEGEDELHENLKLDLTLKL